MSEEQTGLTKHLINYLIYPILNLWKDYRKR